MKTVFVDSNVFLRFFTADEGDEHQKAARLFRQAAAGKMALVTGPPVLFEIAWAMRSSYQQPREKVLETLSIISGLAGLTLLDAGLVSEAISLARRSGGHFADAYVAVAARAGGADEIASFNRAHFERLGAKLAEL